MTSPVYITLRAAPSGGWYGYVRDHASHAILDRTGLCIDRVAALQLIGSHVNASAFKWSLVEAPDDAPPLFATPDQVPPC